MLNVNGRSEVVARDAAAYQHLIEQAASVDCEEVVAVICEGLADVEAGRIKSAHNSLAKNRFNHRPRGAAVKIPFSVFRILGFLPLRFA